MDNRATAWSNYWRKGFLTTFVGNESDYYSGEVGSFWKNCFDSAPDDGTIIDIGAGNGALLSLATDFMGKRNRNFQLIALDYSDITQSKFYIENPHITLQPNTAAEKTGFNCDFADLCVSQFGFEYSNTEESSREIFRILRPAGKFHALLHHHRSEVAIDAQSATAQITLCQRSELTETTARLLNRLDWLKRHNEDLSKDKTAFQLRTDFNDTAGRLLQYTRQTPTTNHIDYFLNELGNLFGDKAKILSLQKKLGIIEQLKTDSTECFNRMKAMLDASSNHQKISKIAEQLTAAGFEVVQPEKIIKGGRPFSWCIKSIKPPTS